jgi:NAD dependent epimerase/dehydratase family enzyme
MSSVILKGTRVSAEKIMKAGFQFNYINLHEALDNIINN